MDADDVTAFLARYRGACTEAGAKPIPLDDLTVVIGIILPGQISATIALH